jgi:hypothetical protein
MINDSANFDKVGEKKPYTQPQLSCFGDFRDLTLGGGGAKVNDGGVGGPATRP